MPHPFKYNVNKRSRTKYDSSISHFPVCSKLYLTNLGRFQHNNNPLHSAMGLAVIPRSVSDEESSAAMHLSRGFTCAPYGVSLRSE